MAAIVFNFSAIADRLAQLEGKARLADATGAAEFKTEFLNGIRKAVADDQRVHAPLGSPALTGVPQGVHPVWVNAHTTRRR